MDYRKYNGLQFKNYTIVLLVFPSLGKFKHFFYVINIFVTTMELIHSLHIFDYCLHNFVNQRIAFSALDHKIVVATISIDRCSGIYNDTLLIAATIWSVAKNYCSIEDKHECVRKMGACASKIHSLLLRSVKFSVEKIERCTKITTALSNISIWLTTTRILWECMKRNSN